LSGTYLSWEGEKYQRTWIDVRIYKFRGLRKLTALAASPLTDEMRVKLAERGRAYVQLAGVHFKVRPSYNRLSKDAISSRRTGVRRRSDLCLLRRDGQQGASPSPAGQPGCKQRAQQVEKRRADGRVSIDRESYRKMHPSGYAKFARSPTLSRKRLNPGAQPETRL
jgi:hypothetical protein